jgi:hypothetical protein
MAHCDNCGDNTDLLMKCMECDSKFCYNCGMNLAGKRSAIINMVLEKEDMEQCPCCELYFYPDD